MIGAERGWDDDGIDEMNDVYYWEIGIAGASDDVLHFKILEMGLGLERVVRRESKYCTWYFVPSYLWERMMMVVTAF